MTKLVWLALLGLLAHVPLLRGSSEYEYLWKEMSRGYGQDQHCTKIPADLRLCHGVGYTDMLLPNLLEHETMAEVKQQASSWVPLVHKGCHAGTQIFLCTLFAPVCLEKPVRPCRQLCEAVRDACSPIMEAFGFLWPEMFDCSKFPLLEEEMCINLTVEHTLEPSDGTAGKATCPPCDEMNTDIILEHMCASEFAIKSRIKEALSENVDTKVSLQKKRKAVKVGDLRKDELKNLVLYLKNGEMCSCPQLDDPKAQYLIMGRKVGQRHLLTGIHKWNKSNKFKKVLKQLKTQKCAAFETF